MNEDIHIKYILYRINNKHNAKSNGTGHSAHSPLPIPIPTDNEPISCPSSWIRPSSSTQSSSSTRSFSLSWSSSSRTPSSLCFLCSPSSSSTQPSFWTTPSS